jgi:hypothetical protein
MQLQPYTRQDGTKSAWVLLAYEETKGMGHSLAASEHDDDLGDEIIGSETDEHGQTKPIKQDLGKNLIYHSFDFRQPDLVSPGHLVNLPGLCGGLYPTWCDDPKTPDIIETNLENPACSCTPGEPVPLYFDYQTCTDPADPATCTWMPDDTKFLQYRTEIARRARFIVQGKNRLGPSGTIGTILFKQGQEGQGRPADVFIRRIVVPTTDKGYHNPYRFENFECTTYLDDTFNLPGCPTDGVAGYNCNVWGEAAGDRLCGGVFEDPNGGYPRRDHVNLTSADINLAVDAGPDDDTPDDPTDDRYGTNKVLLWSQHEYNLGDESFGLVHDDGTPCDVLNGEVCPGMYSNARSHRGMIRRDALVLAFNLSPNWAAARNGNDRYNFYVRRSFDGGQTWTTTPAEGEDYGGSGVYACPEWRADPNADDPDGTGHLPPAGIDLECDPCPWVEDGTCTPTDSAVFYPAGEFEPARNISEIGNNKESASDPRIGGLPEILPVDGTVMPRVPIQYDEDIYEDGIYFAAWGTADNEKFTGGGDIGGEIAPLDVYYTRTSDWGDTYLKVPWDVNGTNSNQYGETVWRYQKIAWGDEEQGECQLKATSDGSKAYVVYLELIEDATDEEWTRWYPWELEFSHDHDVWFRRLIFWPEDLTPAEP